MSYLELKVRDFAVLVNAKYVCYLHLVVCFLRECYMVHYVRGKWIYQVMLIKISKLLLTGMNDPRLGFKRFLLGMLG